MNKKLDWCSPPNVVWIPDTATPCFTHAPIDNNCTAYIVSEQPYRQYTEKSILKADSVQVTFGDSVIIQGFKQSMRNAREYNKRMGFDQFMLTGSGKDE